jgi:hypothetical protein
VKLTTPSSAEVKIDGAIPPHPYMSSCRSKGKEGKAIPVTGHEDPQGCETSRLPHFLDSRLTDGGEDVSLTRRPPLISPEDS